MSAGSKKPLAKKAEQKAENFFQKLTKTQKIIGGAVIGGVVGLVLIITLVIGGGAGSPDSVAKRYCDILVKGNYGDLLDIADMPDSEFITKDVINGAKAGFREKFAKKNSDAVTCTYTLANEDDEKVSYKLVINDKNTREINIKKSNNKVIIDDVYVEREIWAPNGTTVTIDGKDLSKYKTDKTYRITVLVDNPPTVKASHPLLTSEQEFNVANNVRFQYGFDHAGDPTGDHHNDKVIVRIKEEYLKELEELSNTIGSPSDSPLYYLYGKNKILISKGQRYYLTVRGEDGWKIEKTDTEWIKSDEEE